MIQLQNEGQCSHLYNKHVNVYNTDSNMWISSEVIINKILIDNIKQPDKSP